MGYQLRFGAVVIYTDDIHELVFLLERYAPLKTAEQKCRDKERLRVAYRSD